MGNVFLGHHELLDLPMAVKLLRPELLRSPEMRGRILREAQIAARVSHANIVRLHEVGETASGRPVPGLRICGRWEAWKTCSVVPRTIA